MSIQDFGRIGFAKKGIPKGGVMDFFAANLANTLLNNDISDAVIEITFGFGKLEFTSNTFICLTGGDFSPKLNAISIKMNSIIEIKKGDVLSFGKRKYGARTYLAVDEGIQSDLVLNSRSFFQGITPFDRLRKGDVVQIRSQSKLNKTNNSRVKIENQHFTSRELQCYKGPEFERLNENQKESLMGYFIISEDNNRVGYRLKESLENNLKPILTSSVLPGTVQLTPSGKLIVLMRDCQVTGGYPRILQLSNESIDKLAQKITGDMIRFKII